MSNLYDELKNNNKVASKNIQNECDELCLKIENNIKQRALDGFKDYKCILSSKLQFDRFSCGIVEYFKNKGVYCKRDYCVNNNGYDTYNTYYIEFKWDKTLKEYMIIEKIKSISSVIVLFGIIFGIILMFAFN